MKNLGQFSSRLRIWQQLFLALESALLSDLRVFPLGYQPFNSLNHSSRCVAGFVSIIKLDGCVVEPIPLPIITVLTIFHAVHSRRRKNFANSHRVDIDWLCLDSQEADVVMPKNHNLTKLSEYLKYSPVCTHFADMFCREKAHRRSR
jgi:hypothetical protein